ncbi:MAG: discoidin domain-containing protein, partial [Candidatus Omnitrophica bacterium]|nr:discoidin domain-containing protein [Candidatus Omnitrophota bacterium]
VVEINNIYKKEIVLPEDIPSQGAIGLYAGNGADVSFDNIFITFKEEQTSGLEQHQVLPVKVSTTTPSLYNSKVEALIDGRLEDSPNHWWAAAKLPAEIIFDFGKPIEISQIFWQQGKNFTFDNPSPRSPSHYKWECSLDGISYKTILNVVNYKGDAKVDRFEPISLRYLKWTIEDTFSGIYFPAITEVKFYSNFKKIQGEDRKKITEVTKEEDITVNL